MASGNWINDLLGKDVAANTSIATPRRGVVNFLNGSGIVISAVDNPTTGYTDVTIAASGSATGGVDYKDSCRVATTANITLSGLQTVDGVSLSAADRVAVWKQTTQSENGIYLAASGAWTRATDANTSLLVTSGMQVQVASGTLYGGRTLKLITADPIVLGTTGLTFELQPQTLAEVLAKGNSTGATNIIWSDSQYAQFGTTNPASTGTVRLRNAASIFWRNAANTGNIGIEVDGVDALSIGGGSADADKVQLVATTAHEFYIGGTLASYVYTPLPDIPAIALNPNFGGGTGTLAIIGVVAPTTARAGMDLYALGGPGGTGNQAGGSLVIGPGAPSGSGAVGGVRAVNAAFDTIAEFIDDATPRIGLHRANLRFGMSVASPKIWQADQTAGSTNGQKLSLLAQNATGATSTGGAIDIGPGAGTTAGGLGRLISGSGSQRAAWNDTGFAVFGATPVAQPADQVAFTDNVGGTLSRTLAAIPDPADSPGTADALRDDLVANVIPIIRNAVSSLADGYNDVRANVLRPLGLTA
jgi:hypothetical protein